MLGLRVNLPGPKEEITHLLNDRLQTSHLAAKRTWQQKQNKVVPGIEIYDKHVLVKSFFPDGKVKRVFTTIDGKPEKI